MIPGRYHTKESMFYFFLCINIILVLGNYHLDSPLFLYITKPAFKYVLTGEPNVCKK